jgi:hypothetical protein
MHSWYQRGSHGIAYGKEKVMGKNRVKICGKRRGLCIFKARQLPILTTKFLLSQGINASHSCINFNYRDTRFKYNGFFLLIDKDVYIQIVKVMEQHMEREGREREGGSD